MPYVIIKYITNNNSSDNNDNEHKIPVIMLDVNDEVWEFNDREKAEHIANILTINSTTGKEYEIKKV